MLCSEPLVGHVQEFPTIRGDYDYCPVPGTRQLSPFEVGEDNSKFESEKQKILQIRQYGQTKGCYRGFQVC